MASEDSDSEDLDIKSFYKKYEKKSIKTFYKDSSGKHNIDTTEINNDIKDYINGMIFKYDFSQKYNAFINNFNIFRRAQGKKRIGAIGSNQKKLLEYGEKLEQIVKKTFPNPSGSQSGERLKILTPKQMFTRLPILLAQIKAGNNSRELKNEIRQLLYSLYRSKQISKTVYKNLITTI